MRLSIITVNLNNIRGLQKTMDSVISQSFKDFEWIVIDGGSTDGSRELIEQNQDKITYWVSEPDKGIYHAMNKGICQCNGDYIVCMNSGDTFYSSDTLHNIFCKEYNADILYGDCVLMFNNRAIIKKFPSTVGIHYFWNGNICQQAMFVKTSLLKGKGFDESYKIMADYKMWIELAIQGAEFKKIDFPVCYYDMNGVSSRDSKLLAEEQNKIRTILPPAISVSVQRLCYYEDSFYIKKLEALLQKGGIIAFLVKAIIKMFSLFL